MNQAHFRFYAELNDFLPSHRQKVTFTHPFSGRVSVKDMIESLGVPHTEVDLILVNGRSVDFTYLVQDDDRISVYPVFESLDITPIIKVRSRALRQTRFVLDSHLGKLATYLRLFGFDTLYRNDYEDEELARISSEEKRILLTRDRGLLKRRIVTHGYWLRATNPRQQLIEVLQRFDLFQAIAPFQRCLHCNGKLRPVSKEAIREQLPAMTKQYYDEFHRCQSCQQVFWKGSHYQRMEAFVEQVLEKAVGNLRPILGGKP